MPGIMSEGSAVAARPTRRPDKAEVGPKMLRHQGRFIGLRHISGWRLSSKVTHYAKKSHFDERRFRNCIRLRWRQAGAIFPR
jgi:hypothetical protein